MNQQAKPETAQAILYQDNDFAVINKPDGLFDVSGRGPDKQDCAAARLRRRQPIIIDQPTVY